MSNIVNIIMAFAIAETWNCFAPLTAFEYAVIMALWVIVWTVLDINRQLREHEEEETS